MFHVRESNMMSTATATQPQPRQLYKAHFIFTLESYLELNDDSNDDNYDHDDA